jgi:hypothetical protein
MVALNRTVTARDLTKIEVEYTDQGPVRPTC